MSRALIWWVCMYMLRGGMNSHAKSAGKNEWQQQRKKVSTHTIQTSGTIADEKSISTTATTTLMTTTKAAATDKAIQCASSQRIMGLIFYYFVLCACSNEYDEHQFKLIYLFIDQIASDGREQTWNTLAPICSTASIGCTRLHCHHRLKFKYAFWRISTIYY